MAPDPADALPEIPAESFFNARLTDRYRPQDLEGRLVVAVVNLPPRQIGPIRSEVLILGAYERGGDAVALLAPDGDCEPGDRIG